MSGFIYDMLKLQNEWELTSCFQSLSFYCTTLSSLQLLCLLDDQSTAADSCHRGANAISRAGASLPCTNDITAQQFEGWGGAVGWGDGGGEWSLGQPSQWFT